MTTKDCRDLGIPAGKSLYDHYTPPSVSCTLSANKQVGRRKKASLEELLKTKNKDTS